MNTKALKGTMMQSAAESLAGDWIRGLLLAEAWAVTRPGILEIIVEALATAPQASRRAALDRPQGSSRRDTPVRDGVAVIPIKGLLLSRDNTLTRMLGLTTYERIGAELVGPVNDDAVRAIVLDVDSPGGSVAGAAELAAEIRRARTRKPIIAVAEYTAASAAYWLAASASEVVAAPSAQIGSIGIFAIHDDLSKSLAMEGISREYVIAGKYKADDNETHALTGEAARRWQRMVNASLATFHRDVSEGRKVSLDTVRGQFGEGALVSADAALRARMIDRIATLDTVVREAVNPTAGSTGRRPSTRAHDRHDHLWLAQMQLQLLEQSSRRRPTVH